MTHPAPNHQAETLRQPSAEDFGASTDPRPLRILVVEDHRDTLRMLELYLRHLGHDVRGAPTVRAAFQIADEWHFEALLCDIGLSDGDGCQLVRELLAVRKFAAIAMSGYNSAKDLARGEAAGFEQYLTKPFDPAKLEALLRELGRRDPGP